MSYRCQIIKNEEKFVGCNFYISPVFSWKVWLKVFKLLNKIEKYFNEYEQVWKGIWCHYKYYRVNGEDECKDVTVGDCELKADQIVYTSIISDAGLCQFLCNTLTDCNVFQFHESEQNCTLLKEDYHQDCQSSSGPEVSSIVVWNRRCQSINNIIEIII